MSDNLAQLDGGRFLADEYSKDSIRATFFQKIIDAINKLGTTLGANPVGEVAPPNPINNINVATSGEYMQVALNHNSAVNRGVHYFVEVAANDPNFTQPQVLDMGASRSPLPFLLPTLDNNGNAISYYVRAYAQYPGSKPSEITTFGGPLNPTPIQMGGTTKLSPLPSTGSGTASPSGQQGGSGMGKNLVRPSLQPPIRVSIGPTSSQVSLPPTPAPIGIIFNVVYLASNLGVIANTPTNVISLTITMPPSGGPFRVLCPYGLACNATSANNIGTLVTDGTSVFGITGSETDGSSIQIGFCAAAPLSPQYDNGQAVTLTLNVETTVNATIDKGNNATWLQALVLTSN